MRGTSASDRQGYPEFCASAASGDDAFAVFRAPTKNSYTRVLEHFSRSDGEDHLIALKERNPEIAKYLSRFASSNNVGAPELFDYGFDGLHAASTLRYARNLGDLHEKFGSLNDLHIVEIGSGYGGLAKVVFDAFTPGSYTLIDLPEAVQLAGRFLRATLSPENYKRVKLVDGTKLCEPLHSDLAISNCAFSECSPKVQKAYIRNVLAPAKRGSLLINLRRESLPPAILWRDLAMIHPSLICSEEVPLTHPTNFMLSWGVDGIFLQNAHEFPHLGQLPFATAIGDANYMLFYRVAYWLKLKKRLRSVGKFIGITRAVHG